MYEKCIKIQNQNNININEASYEDFLHIGLINQFQKNYSEAIKNYQINQSYIDKLLKNNFIYLTEKEKKHFLKKIKVLLDILQSFNYATENKYSSITELNINNCLTYKGILFKLNKKEV